MPGNSSKLNISNPISRSISLPVKRKFDNYNPHRPHFHLDNSNSNIINNRRLNHKNKYYNLIRNYNPTFHDIQKYQDSNTFDLPHLKANADDLVQLISMESNDLAYVKLINRLGQGLIPLKYLAESAINNTTNNIATIPATTTLLEGITAQSSHVPTNSSHAGFSITPPASPLSLNSKSFDIANSKRSKSVSASSSSHSPNSSLNSNSTPMVSNLNELSDCRIISINNNTNKNRLQYVLKLIYANSTTTSSSSFTLSTLFYSNFYNLHVYLLQTNLKQSIPNLPPPTTTIATINSNTGPSSSGIIHGQNPTSGKITGINNPNAEKLSENDERINLFNNYLQSIISLIKTTNDTTITATFIHWLFHGKIVKLSELQNLNSSPLTPKGSFSPTTRSSSSSSSSCSTYSRSCSWNENSIKIKIHFKNDCYIVKSTFTEVDTLNKLKQIIIKKINNSSSNSNLNYSSLTMNNFNIISKIFNWYIIELTNESIYNDILLKLSQDTSSQSRLVLTIIENQ
ncbi:hypothetical protein TBLA_0I00730 [Henningerozyma blattae CBS 6284]|uniref:Uncharacterized protein n=1 Tax=Henningerozyma blattae (strain ATCC 34711 / CBS 6284 / DSM 70876 / NBRC 10599 / NRRL Y-10934 / UCD 77-7) TaxID=1071380 RepID=I2H8M9_HENB6|nr:hypothetical protein TBLA_0I00730 [Tetrapisispora blattae CBS 6284]CCH62731.1 hypothetical protein TBLA_0I00730 [Tetrapisispora blattae CBS 6284]